MSQRSWRHHVSQTTVMKVQNAISRILYGLSIGINAVLLGLVVTVAFGPLFPEGESWFGLAYIWLFSIPIVGLLSIVAVAFYSRYARLDTARRAVTFYVVQVVLVTVTAFGLTVLVGVVRSAY